jgi:predicted MFS family arabinose efflux permease
VPYFNVYFNKVLNASVLQTGLVFAVADALMVIGFMMIPYISTRMGMVRSAALTQAISIPFLVVMAVTTNFAIASGAYVARMLFMNISGPATTSFQMQIIKPEERGFATGLMSTGNSVAIAGSTYIGGLLMAHGNYLIPYAVTCLAYAVAALLLYECFKDNEDAGARKNKTASEGLSLPSA